MINEEISVAAVAVVSKDAIIVFTVPRPGRHGDVMQLMNKHGINMQTFPEYEHEQGFVTNLGRFVDRRQALVIAIDAQQVQRDKIYNVELFTEDMW